MKGWARILRLWRLLFKIKKFKNLDADFGHMVSKNINKDSKGIIKWGT